MTETTTLDDSTLAIAVDSEHGALRLSMLGVFALLFVISYILINGLLSGEGMNILAVFISLGVSFVAGQQIEKTLKVRWPSGRYIEINSDSISISKGQQTEETVDSTQQVNVLLWRFTIKRRARVPKGWYMVACALEQDTKYISAYTFMSADSFKELASTNLFTELVSKKDSRSKTVDRDLRLAGQQRRLHTAESQRWMHGAEMSTDDFVAYIAHLQTHFPQWMPTNS